MRNFLCPGIRFNQGFLSLYVQIGFGAARFNPRLLAWYGILDIGRPQQALGLSPNPSFKTSNLFISGRIRLQSSYSNVPLSSFGLCFSQQSLLISCSPLPLGALWYVLSHGRDANWRNQIAAIFFHIIFTLWEIRNHSKFNYSYLIRTPINSHSNSEFIIWDLTWS